MQKNKPNIRILEVSKEEERLIKMIRKIGHGELKIVAKDSRPYRVVEIEKSILLGDDSFFHKGIGY